jgi:hypothetical protein
MKIPKWLEELASFVCDTCISDVKGRMSGFSSRWSRPQDKARGEPGS